MESNKNQGNNLPPVSYGRDAQTNVPPPGQAAAPTENQRYRFQPLGFGQLFDLTLKLYADNFKYLMGVVAVCMSPVLVSNFLSSSNLLGVTQAGAKQSSLPVGELIIGFAVLQLLVVCFVLQQGAIIWIVYERYLNETPSIRRALAAAKARFWTLLGGTILYGLISLLCAIPAGLVVYLPFMLLDVSASIKTAVMWPLILLITQLLTAGYSQYPMAIMLEGYGATGALSRSAGLVKGSWFKIVLITAICYLAIKAASSVPDALMWIIKTQGGGPSNMSSPGVIALKTLKEAVGYVVAPILDIALMLFYFDLRVRKEGLDLEMLAKEIG